MAVGIKRVYEGFTGVDFLNEPSLVGIQRSPDAKNVWKNYQDNKGLAIETRPGITKIAQFDNARIYGLYVLKSDKALVHCGTKLYLWSNFPDEPVTTGDNITLTLLYSSMNTARSVFNQYPKSEDDQRREYIYINDGINYLYYYNGAIHPVSNIAYIPTTTIGRSPSGGGELLEAVNVLQPKRTNTFKGDGTSTAYLLDTTSLDATAVTAVVNGNTITENSGLTVNRTTGVVTFSTAPSVPSISGQDNVFITFAKTINGYVDRIGKCTRALIWDNRMFYTGNLDYPNAIFNSKLNDPTYIGDLSYIEDGSSNSAITDFVVGSNVLWVLKQKDQNNANVFYHTRDLDNEQGAVYPSVQGNVATGCFVSAYNFGDDVVYLSQEGLEGIITTELDSRQIISHRSSMVDVKMINDTDYYESMMCEYKGYLFILVNGKIFLADSRQKYADLSSFQYEWFYWDISSINPYIIKQYNGVLYIGSKDGGIYVLDGTNDNGQAIESYWTTPMDNFGYTNQVKTTSKRGGIIKIKTIPNGRVKVARKTNRSDEYKYLTEKSLNGFNFNNLNFANFSFTTTNQSYCVFKMKEKKINEVSLKIYSDELDKSFGLYQITMEAFVGSYIKK